MGRPARCRDLLLAFPTLRHCNWRYGTPLVEISAYPPVRRPHLLPFRGRRLIRQLVASLIVLLAAVAAWTIFVPGAATTLASYGVTLPFAPPAAEQPGSRAGCPGGPGRQGGATRQTNVVTTPVTLATINDTLSAIGEGTASRSVTVSSPAGGTLAEVLVRPGQAVERGDVIARLDSEAEQIAF